MLLCVFQGNPNGCLCSVDTDTCLCFRGIPVGGSVRQTLESDGCGGLVQYLEHTQVHVRLNVRRRGDLRIKLTSPSGTESVILSLRERDKYSGGKCLVHTGY